MHPEVDDILTIELISWDETFSETSIGGSYVVIADESSDAEVGYAEADDAGPLNEN